MDGFFSRKVRVTQPDCEVHDQMRLSAMMRLIQQIGADHLDALGLAHDKLWNEGFVFLLTKEYVEIYRAPRSGEEVVVKTCPLKPKGAQFLRNVYLETPEGEPLAEGYTSWVLVDPHSHKIHRPGDWRYPLPYVEPEKNLQVTAMKAQKPEQEWEMQEYKVRYSDLDCNRHVNNAVYGDLALDVLPLEIVLERQVSRFFVHFVKEARVRETISLHYGPLDGENCWYIGGEVAGHCCFEAQVWF